MVGQMRLRKTNMMQPKYKSIPLSREQINELKKNPLWNEMVNRYGEENVINNYVVDFVVLQEERAIFDSMEQKIDVTADLIRKVYQANNTLYQQFVEAPINKIKSWVKDSPDLIGHVPIQEREGRWIDDDTFIITDHDNSKMADKAGLILSGSYKMVSLPNKDGKPILHLLCKGILLSPKSKWGHVTGNWRQVSPTILQSYKISELSYVAHSAQMGNSSLSNGEPTITNTNEVATMSLNLDEIRTKLLVAEAATKAEQLNNEVQKTTSRSESLADYLVAKGYITSGKKKRVSGYFMQLGGNEAKLTANIIEQIGNKTHLRKGAGVRTVFLQGAVTMSSVNERYEEFRKENEGKYNTAVGLMSAFQNSEQEFAKKLSLANGEGALIDPKNKWQELLDLLEKDEEVDSEIKEKVISLCSSKFGMKLADGGGTIDAGGVAQPNNASSSLSGGEDKLKFDKQNEEITILKESVNKLLEGYDALQKQNTDLGTKLAQLNAKQPDNNSSQGELDDNSN